MPNALSVARLLALPVLLTILWRAEGPTAPWAALLFGVVGATDLLDGFLARRLGAETRFGRIVDPLADRLLVLVGLVGVILLDRIHPAGPALIIGRDLALMIGFAILLRFGVEMRVDGWGKLSSALAMLGTGGAILLDALWVDVLFWIAVAAGLATLGHYAVIAVRRLRADPAAGRGPRPGPEG